MIFMEFTEYEFDYSGSFEENKIWIQLDHIASVRRCPRQTDRTWIELNGGAVHEVEGNVHDILKEIVNEYRERGD